MDDAPEFKTLTFDLKAATGDDDPGGFEAILSTPARDREGETVRAKAFEPLPASVPIHWAHDFVNGGLPIGKGVPYYDGDTLKITGTFAPTAKAQEVRELVNGGFVTSMSAGFITDQRKGRTIIKASLLEGSLTATPVNPSALVLASKALMTLDEVRAAEGIDDAGFSAKAGARNSKADSERIQTMHDHAVALGAVCSAAEKAIDEDTPDLDTKAAASPEPAEKAAPGDAPADADELELQRQRARAWQMTA